MHGDDLDWLTERACREAWPAAEEAMVDGWLMRRSGGKNRRSNSANPLRGSRGSTELTIEHVEAFYAQHHQTPMFRVPAIADEIDAGLDRRGYGLEGGTIHLFGEIDELARLPDGGIGITPEPAEDWLEARSRMTDESPDDSRIYRKMIGLIAHRKAFASAVIDGMIVSRAYAVIVDGLLVLESVETDARFRQQGLGRKTVGALIGWGRSAGARAACLQVVIENAPARALYRALGFRRELYQYHYRRKPAAHATGA